MNELKETKEYYDALIDASNRVIKKHLKIVRDTKKKRLKLILERKLLVRKSLQIQGRKK